MELNFFFRSNIAIYFSLGLHKGRPSYGRSLQPSKENIQYFKKWILTFFYFFGSLLPFWIPVRIWIPEHHWIRIRIHSTDFQSSKHPLKAVSLFPKPGEERGGSAGQIPVLWCCVPCPLFPAWSAGGCAGRGQLRLSTQVLFLQLILYIYFLAG